MRWTVAVVLAAAALAAAGGGCGDADDAATTTGPAADGGRATPLELSGRTFVSAQVEGRKLVPGTQIRLAFEVERLAAAAGCNTLTGAWRLDGATLRFDGPPAATQIGCEPALQRQDEWLAGWLTAGVEASAVRDGLRLAGQGVVVELREDARPSQPPPIAGTRWTLTSIGGPGDTVASVPAGVEPPTLEISDGVARVFTGCNHGRGPARVRDDGFVDFGPLALTRKACGADAAETEQAVTAVLDGSVAAGYEQDRLVLAKDGRHLTFAAG